MAVFERINNILRANLNDMLDRAEDPEKMLNQIIRDMEVAIQDAKSQVADMIAQEKVIKRDMEHSQELADEWEQKAELAVQKERDDLALEALRRKGDYQEHTDVYRQQWEAQKAAVERLKGELDVIRTSERLDSVDYGAELERMERRIVSEEARAEAETEMADESIEDQFAELEQDDDLQTELEQLKARVGGTAG
jgi:phage shock protein A